MISINPIQTSYFSGELNVLYEDVYPLMESGYCVAILAGTEKAAYHLAQDLQKMGPVSYTHLCRIIGFRRFN